MIVMIQKLLLLLVIAACTVGHAFAFTLQVVDQDGNPIEGAVVMATELPPQKPDVKTAIVDQVDKQFLPVVQTVQVGTLVSFPNSDSIRHHVYSFSKPKPFEIKLYSGVPTQPILFDKPGLVVMGCNIHDGMVGYLVIADQHFIDKTDEKGELTLAEAPDKLMVWHPKLLQGIDSTEEISIAQGTTSLVHPLQLKATPKEQTSRFGSGINRYAK